MRILVVEDDEGIAGDVAAGLTAAGFRVDIVHDGEAAMLLGDTENYALVVLDLGLPGLDGLTVLKHWRAGNRTMPVLALTARYTWQDRVDGIYAGADDYLAKPFNMMELIARVRAVIRRSAGHADAVIGVGNVVLDTRQMQVTVGDRQVRLTALEYRLFNYLLHHKGRVVSAGELIEQLYGNDQATENALEALILRLRRKLGAHVIETRRGFGYVIPDPP
ncbi:MAG: response regulator transcription factor [Hyphomicrobiaceae bacterium]